MSKGYKEYLNKNKRYNILIVSIQILIIISFLVNFIFYGISLSTVFESIISVSFVVFIEEIYEIFTKKIIY